MPRWANSAELRELVEPRWGAPRSWRCVYCGRTTGQDVQIDHFTPRERGGLDLPWNLVPACPGCNASKKDHDPIAWMREVGVHPATALALEQIAQKPRWKYKPGDFLFRASSLQYRRVEGEALNTGPSWLQNVSPTLVLPRNLSEVFVLDSDAWSPTVALRRVAGSYLTDHGYPAISSQQLNRDLEARRLRRTTRDGRPGYRGFYTIPGAAADFTPSHADLAASRYRRKLISDNRF